MREIVSKFKIQLKRSKKFKRLRLIVRILVKKHLFQKFLQLLYKTRKNRFQENEDKLKTLFYYKQLKFSLLENNKKIYVLIETLVHTVEESSQSLKLLVATLVRLIRTKARPIKRRLRLATIEQYKDKYYNILNQLLELVKELINLKLGQ